MTRLENIILYLLLRAKKKGKKNLSKFELFKFLYLLEIESYKFTGKSFLGSINFVREKNGPISYDVYNALADLEGEYIKMEARKKTDYPYARHCISLKKPLNKFDLPESEKLFINSVLESYLSLSMKKLKEIVYNTQPIKEIQEKEMAKKITLIGQRINFNSIPLDKEVVDLITA